MGDANRAARAGAVLLALYVAVAAGTALWAPGRPRPLFDGFASHPGQYLWVDPPKEFAVGNTPPEKAQAGVIFEGGTSQPSNAVPPDGQAVAALEPGAVPPRQGEESAVVRLEPVDPGELGALPAGLRPESNAYKVTVTYEPSKTPLPTLAKESTIGLTSVVAAEVLLYSEDGTAWEREESLPLKQGTGLSGRFTGTGYFLAANEGPLREEAGGGGGVPVVLVGAGLAVPLVLGYLLLSRRSVPNAKGGTGAKGGKGVPAKGPTAKKGTTPAGTKPRPPQKRTGGSSKAKRR